MVTGGASQEHEGARLGRPSRVRAASALLAGLVVVVAGGAVACGPGADGRGAPTPPTTPSTRAPSTSTSTTVATTTTTEVAPGAPTEPTRPGDAGPQVEALQQRLFSLGYLFTAFSGTYDADTSNAVMAFQKLHGLARDGVAGPDTLGALEGAVPVAARHGTGPHLEVDLAAQVLLVVDPDGRTVAVNATSGAPASPTPPGTFTVFRQVDAWDPGPYGSLYRPKYFNGGIAVHGGVPVVAGPVSHGCIRIPDPAVDWLWSSGLAAIGTTVVVA